MNRNNDVHAYMFEQSIHTGVVIGCFDAFCQTITQKTVVVMDNASIHRSEEFADRIPYWKKQGLIIKYLPPYSPELNLIEILWQTPPRPPLRPCVIPPTGFSPGKTSSCEGLSRAQNALMSYTV